MVKHIILWQIKDDADKASVKKNAKEALEGLAGKIDGLLSVKVHINGLESSNADMMLETSFTDEAALKGYSVHPLHVKAADTYVRPFTKLRVCLDFEDQ
jgi:stress responsive A/B barrel domain protein